MRSIAVVAIAVGSVALGAGVAHASTPASAPPEPTASATEDEAVAAFVAEFGDVWRHGPNCIYYEGDENWLCQAGTEDEVFVSAYGYERDDVWVWVSVGRMSGLEADQPGGITWAIYDTPLAHQIYAYWPARRPVAEHLANLRGGGGDSAFPMGPGSVY